MKVVCLIDCQNDFISGVLGTKEAEVARDNICNWLQKNVTCEDKVIITQDTHSKVDYFETQEGKNLPVFHCEANSNGWMIDSKIANTINVIQPWLGSVIKDTFGSMEVANRMPAPGNKVDSIYLLGFCTDICVISNAMILKAAYPEIPIYVIDNCCAGTTPEKHQAALSVMESCQIKVIKE
ncbi:MAG: cysteine hydrolase [Lachnospiraceae bacterium]|nr:cysteine hydrolase [Lachnospiraceae bacterium]